MASQLKLKRIFFLLGKLILPDFMYIRWWRIGYSVIDGWFVLIDQFSLVRAALKFNVWGARFLELSVNWLLNNHLFFFATKKSKHWLWQWVRLRLVYNHRDFIFILILNNHFFKLNSNRLMKLLLCCIKFAYLINCVSTEFISFLRYEPLWNENLGVVINHWYSFIRVFFLFFGQFVQFSFCYNEESIEVWYPEAYQEIFV